MPSSSVTRPKHFHPIHYLILLICLLSICTCRTQPPQPPAVEPHSLLIQAVALVDPATNTTSPPRDVRIVDGKIAEITEADTVDPASVSQVLDGRGRFLLAGLIDVHAHLGDGGIGPQTREDRHGALLQFVAYGVTSIFVPGGGGGNDLQLAEWKQARANHPYPEIFGSGALLTAPGSHPISTLWGMDETADAAATFARGATPVAEDEPVQELLQQKKDLGVDAIKIVIEDGPDPQHPRPRLSLAKVKELVDAAHALDLRVFAHISLAEHLDDAVAAGADGVMHSADDPIADATLQTMAERGIFYVATLSLYDGFFKEALGQRDVEPYAAQGIAPRAIESLANAALSHAPAESTDWVEPTRQNLQANLRRAAAAGVPLALGSDVNNPTVFPGYSTHEELALMVEAGLTPAQALQAATTGSAAFLNQSTRLGKIAPGYDADLLLLANNPLENILHTRTLLAVLRKGTPHATVISTQPAP